MSFSPKIKSAGNNKSAQDIQDDIFRKMSANDKLAVGAGSWRLAKELDSYKVDLRKMWKKNSKI